MRDASPCVVTDYPHDNDAEYIYFVADIRHMLPVVRGLVLLASLVRFAMQSFGIDLHSSWLGVSDVRLAQCSLYEASYVKRLVRNSDCLPKHNSGNALEHDGRRFASSRPLDRMSR